MTNCFTSRQVTGAVLWSSAASELGGEVVARGRCWCLDTGTAGALVRRRRPACASRPAGRRAQRARQDRAPTCRVSRRGRCLRRALGAMARTRRSVV